MVLFFVIKPVQSKTVSVTDCFISVIFKFVDYIGCRDAGYL